MDEMSRRCCTVPRLWRSQTVGLRLATAIDTGAGFNCLPESCFMTPITLWAETSLMLVILLVTTYTGGRGCDFLAHARGMAGITIKPFMTTVNPESGPCIVIEVPEFPVS